MFAGDGEASALQVKKKKPLKERLAEKAEQRRKELEEKKKQVFRVIFIIKLLLLRNILFIYFVMSHCYCWFGIQTKLLFFGHVLTKDVFFYNRNLKKEYWRLKKSQQKN